MNPVLILSYNNVELTRRCVESVRAQDIATHILIIDNGSTDGTCEWLGTQSDIISHLKKNNEGVSKGWNEGLELLFTGSIRRLHLNASSAVYDHCLVLNNDVVLPKWFYRKILSCEGPFITGVAIDTMPLSEPDECPLTPHPDFSAFLIRKGCWNKVGAFDETMVMYAQDTDYHVRAHRLGVPLMKAGIEYFHVNSQTLRRATPEVRQHITGRANADREIFKQRYGCLPGTPAYEGLFK